MDISVPSRFACLKIEDEEFRPASNRSTKKKQEKLTKKTSPVVNNGNKKVPASQKQSSTTGANATSKKTKTKVKKEDRQWEEWKKKDDEFVNDNFEQDLQCAILQSKLDFENQKKNAVSVVVTTQDTKTKKKKTKTMSLDQFLENGNQPTVKDTEKDPEEEGNFFENVIVSAKHELKKEKLEEKRRERASNIEEVISLAQAQEKLEIEKAKNEQLRFELEEAKKEIALVKKRNTTLCSMLSQGEMKDKVAVLVELERLTNDKEELTEEVARLHKLLEQERSSMKANSAGANGVSDSHNTKHKDKHKKKKN